jgi:hypothetical protein
MKDEVGASSIGGGKANPRSQATYSELDSG